MICESGPQSAMVPKAIKHQWVQRNTQLQGSFVSNAGKEPCGEEQTQSKNKVWILQG